MQLEALKLSLKEWKLVQGLRPLLERATSFATMMEADKHASPSSLIEHLHLLKAELTPRSQASPGNVKTGVEPTAGALIRDVETMFDPAYSLPRCEGATPYVLHRSQCCCGHANSRGDARLDVDATIAKANAAVFSKVAERFRPIFDLTETPTSCRCDLTDSPIWARNMLAGAALCPRFVKYMNAVPALRDMCATLVEATATDRMLAMYGGDPVAAVEPRAIDESRAKIVSVVSAQLGASHRPCHRGCSVRWWPEWTRYLLESDMRENALQFWAEHAQAMPTLAIVARHLLCTVASSVSSDGVFSGADHCESSDGSGPDTTCVEKLVVLRLNRQILQTRITASVLPR